MFWGLLRQPLLRGASEATHPPWQGGLGSGSERETFQLRNLPGITRPDSNGGVFCDLLLRVAKITAADDRDHHLGR